MNAKAKIYLYEKVNRVPPITDAEIAEMRHIEPVLRVRDTCMFQRVAGASAIHPRNQSFLWDACPTGGEFTFSVLNQTTIITQHHCAYLFKPSLDEIYAWIRFYLRDDWQAVRFFCMGEVTRIPATTDYFCQCVLLGGVTLVVGDDFVFPNGEVGHELVVGEPAI